MKYHSGYGVAVDLPCNHCFRPVDAKFVLTHKSVTAVKLFLRGII